MIDFNVYPSGCPVTYQCSVLSGPQSDLCHFSDLPRGAAEFSQAVDPSLGTVWKWVLFSTDSSSVLPGTYVLRITATSDDNSSSSNYHDFSITLVDNTPADPCDAAVISLSTALGPYDYTAGTSALT